MERTLIKKDTFIERYSSKKLKWRRVKITEAIALQLERDLNSFQPPLYIHTRGSLSLYANPKPGSLWLAVCIDNQMIWRMVNASYPYALSTMRNKLQSISISIKLMKDGAWKRETMVHTDPNRGPRYKKR
jgi:hypothetical protein